jgi:hypothetical protein
MKNKTLIFLGKKALKELLAECTEEEFLFFKRMYCHNHLDWNIGDAVDQMDTTKIDSAITQVERTIDKNLKLKS